MKSLCCALVLLALSACASKPAEVKKPVPAPDTSPAAALPAVSPPAPKPAIGDFGVDLSAADKSVKPGDDFFAYANGSWDKTFTIPPDKASFGPFDRLDELSKERVRLIIEKAAAAHAATGTPEQQIGDYYAAFMDEAAIEARGLAPAQEDLERIAAAKTRTDVARLFGTSASRRCSMCSCRRTIKNPDRYAVVISESSLGLPDRDYYLKDDPKLKELREKYVAYIAQMLTFGGEPGPACQGARHHGVRDRRSAAAVADREAPRRRCDLQPAHQGAAARLRAGLSVAGVPRCPAAGRAPGAGARRTHRHP